MFIAMNRFKINLNHDEDFEQVWRERETFLSEVPGFLKFALLRGPQYDSHILYVVHKDTESFIHSH
jgi:heme-degrading monooxygenase HmoA